MSIRGALRITHRRIHIVAGILLVAFTCVQCTHTDAIPQARLVQVTDEQVIGAGFSESARKMEELARTDHIALLEYCLDNYREQYRDYACTFIKQERINGYMGEPQWMEVKFTEKPYSVAMKWTRNATLTDRLIYVEGKFNNQMLVRPASSLLRMIAPSVLKSPTGPEAMSATLRPVNMFGFERAMESLLQVYRKAKSNGNDLKEEFAGYAQVPFAQRNAMVIVRYLPATGDYPACKTVVALDLEYLVPIMVEGYDRDGRLACQYIYKDVKFNVGLTTNDFLPQANDLQIPAQ